MIDYTDEKCPVCNEIFKSGDDIVVCPHCGTPHHRACYGNLGRCANADRHQSDFEWKPEDRGAKKDGVKTKRCAHCGTDNDADSTYCKNCGAGMNSDFGGYHQAGEGHFGAGRFNDFDFGSADDIRRHAFSYNFSLYGGVDPAADIGGASAEDLAVFIGDNSQSFIPRLHFMNRQRAKVSWNWPAFIFGPIYYLYRKMYLFALIAVLISVVFSIPSFMAVISATQAALESGNVASLPNILEDILATREPLLSICSLLSSMLKSVLALFFNYFYGKKAVKKILKIKKNGMVPEMEKSEISRAGGVHRKLLIAIFICYFVLSLFYTLLLLNF